MKYLKKITEEYIYGDNIGKVEYWDFSLSNINLESRIETITTIASISYGNDQAKHPQKLYDFLWKEKHLSVFEFIRGGNYSITDSLRNNPNLPFETNTKNYNNNIFVFKFIIPIFTARQIRTHRGASYCELSRRHTKLNKFQYFYIPQYFKEEDKKQIKNLINISIDIYNKLLQNYKPEIARICLPINLYTEMWVMFDKPNFLNFLQQRTTPETQLETRLVAQKCKQFAKNYITE